MKKHFNKIINGAFLGIGIGFTLNLIFSFIGGEYQPGVPSFLNQFDSNLTAVTVETSIYMLLGVIQIYSNDIMKSEKRSLLANTIIHFSLVFLPLLLFGYILHWSRDLMGLLSVAITVSLVYAIIWIVSYSSIKNEINKINNDIQNRNK